MQTRIPGPQHTLVCRVVPHQVQDFALLLAELPEVSVSPFLQPVKLTLDGSMPLWHVHSSQLCVIGKLAEGTLCPIVQITEEDVKQDWTQY